MPFINLKTNATVSDAKEESLKAAFGQAITLIPGKTEDWLMVGIEPDYKLWFKGSNEPAAMVEISIFGNASDSAYNDLTHRICTLLETELSIPPARTYVKYAEIEHWGWNNRNF